MHAVLPVATELSASGYTVHLVANGKAAEHLAKDACTYFPTTDAQMVLDRYGTPDVLLTSMCSGGGVGRDLVPLLQGKSITVAVQDQWGARLLTDWKDEQYRPDHILVNDDVGKRIVLKAWSEYDPDRVKVTGYAALDKLHGFDVAQVRRTTRALLGLKEETRVVYFSGQLDGTAAALDQLRKAFEM